MKRVSFHLASTFSLLLEQQKLLKRKKMTKHISKDVASSIPSQDVTVGLAMSQLFTFGGQAFFSLVQPDASCW
jgi:hypothetical protein